ncbi:flagellar motor switch protein FliN/FliY [Kineococcus radiotolerans]|uniref:Flagellar motor switch protein FliN n=2 Tax=Kineococcus radiotolerans TaxID=131568 RepID=A6W8L1_KINRD|nr:flagellar motor switch protein FliN [Kineococcus radiotolerans]ABS03150.1 flagellar motor switch protein FliN [Kineococcus radiotolerans SRS30216 = ATCC BAA-149]MBB2899639.1 flagellar motor switch protein FliN/FliY [Kineococcus radiotolerans]
MSTATHADLMSTLREAAQAALAVLPLSAPGTISTVLAVAQAPDLGDEGIAVSANFAGAANGRVTVVVGEETLNTLLMSPEGALDPVDALRPALETVVHALGQCTLEAGVEGDPAQALSQIADGAVAVIDAGGETLALIGLTLTAQPDTTPAPMPSFAPAGTPAPAGPRRTMDLLRDVQMDVTVELGRTSMTVQDLLALTPGSVVELDRAAGSPADVLVNGQLIARGEVVVVDEDYAIRITEIVTPEAGA